MPKLIKSQCLINAKGLPSTNSKIKLMAMSIHKLLDAGYIHIDMDHFALSDDSFSVSLRYTINAQHYFNRELDALKMIGKTS
jgi:oxygen-independent coproporphyrinogen-3 oxidase